MPLHDVNRIRHMLDAAKEAEEFMQGLSLETLPKDRKTLQAVIRCIEIIGEAASKISKEFKESIPICPGKVS